MCCKPDHEHALAGIGARTISSLSPLVSHSKIMLACRLQCGSISDKRAKARQIRLCAEVWLLVADNPILADADTTHVTSQPAATTTEVVQPQKVPAQAVPATPAKSSGKTGPQGMPAGYSGREVQDPDDIKIKHAGESSLLHIDVCRIQL